MLAKAGIDEIAKEARASLWAGGPVGELSVKCLNALPGQSMLSKSLK